MSKLFTKLASSLVAIAFMASLVPAAAFAAATASPVSATTEQGTPVEIVLVGTSDDDLATVTYTADATSANGGTVTVDGQTATYAPTAEFTGTDTFSYTADDGSEAPASSVVTVEVTAPVVTSATVTNQAEFETAMANNDITTITIANDFQITSTLNIDRSVTIIGGGNTITVSDDVTVSAVLITGSDVTINNLTVDSAGSTEKGSAGIQGIQAYKASDVTLNTVTSKNAGKSGIHVNGSTVTVNNVTTSGNYWHGINVDQGTGVTTEATLTVTGESTHGEVFPVPAIFVDDNAKGSVAGNTAQYTLTPVPPGTAYFVNPNYHPIPECDSSLASFDTFETGTVNGQHDWSSTGSFDQAIVDNTYGYSDFGCKSLRILNAVTSGSFGDQTFSYSTENEAGETAAVNAGQSGGTRQDHFDAQFDIASTMTDVQPGLVLSVSPDRGDGARMSYLRFEDTVEGIDVYFDDVPGGEASIGSDDEFTESKIATLDRSTVHTIKFSMVFVDGPGNDVVTISIDGDVVATGTSWEDYYRFDPEQAGSGNVVPTVDSLLFRAGGVAAPATSGNGFLFDNVEIGTSQTPPVSSGSRGGGGRGRSGSSVVPTTVTTPATGGQVLGAATFNFSRDLYFGLVGEDVKELQMELIAAGYSIPAGPTGNFLTQTRAAVAAWQAANGVAPAVGYFGPISRAKYLANGGFGLAVTLPVVTTTSTTTSTTTTATTTATSTSSN